MPLYKLQLTPEVAVVPDMSIGVQMRKLDAPVAAVADVPATTIPHHHFNFGGDYAWEYLTDEGLADIDRIVITRIGAGTVVYEFQHAFDGATNMYDVVTDRIYLRGTKSVDSGATSSQVLAVFDPHTKAIERERVLTDDEAASGNYTSTWDVCGNYWWVGSFGFSPSIAIRTDTLDDAFAHDFAGEYGPAWPDGLLIFDSSNFDNSGWKKITVTGPTTFTEEPFELGAGNQYGSAQDGGYQRPYIANGNRMFLYNDDSSGPPGYIVDIDTLAVHVVATPAGYDYAVGNRARWDSFSNAIALAGLWSPPIDGDNGAGPLIIDVDTASVRGLYGDQDYGVYAGGNGFGGGSNPDGAGFVIAYGAFAADFTHSDTGLFDITGTGRVPEAARIAGVNYPLVVDPPLPFDQFDWFYAVTSLAQIVPGVPGVAAPAAPLKQMAVGVHLDPPFP